MEGDSTREMVDGGNGVKGVEMSAEEELAGRKVSEMEETVAEYVPVCV